MAKWPYNTQAWQRLRKAKLAADPLCQYCPSTDIVPATEVDHAVPIQNGGDPWHWDNLRSACKPCHSRKTMLMDGGGGHAKRDTMPGLRCDPATGRPLDADHWWNSK